MKYCINCGTQMEGGKIFCQNCSTKSEQTQPVEPLRAATGHGFTPSPANGPALAYSTAGAQSGAITKK